eukprot:CAMPEP_0118921024 /NCGR_PEP_ID=MMETSP1169-20130426/422_1 /TAXON_ID=36882 /ORGANISM="Pyramimonas obovata, Strain CCMP722" /LENGTH=201 /DNA_ID=CAMNT_0006861671 /DNA_START=122 /DNA_END=727 /DNA_ORIENTATION=-
MNMKAVAFQRGQLRTNRAVRLSKPAASCVAARRVFTVEANQPTKVGVLMGSPNDLPKMKGAVDMLRTFGLEPDVKVLSAHRQPHDVAQMALGARANGYAAFICGAGMAAHLAGVVSAHTTLPVVGVPLSGGALNGVDALYATVQMPKGIPVATVAIDGSANAAILVAQMLSITNAAIAVKIEELREENRAVLREKNKNLGV